MAVTLITTLSDKYANSYVDVAYCDDFWASHFSAIKAAAWAALTTPQKTMLLVKACRVIETARFTTSVRLNESYHLHYDRRTGVVSQLNEQLMPIKYFFYQSLQFPRNLDRDITTGVVFVPEPIMLAQCEQTVYSLNFDDTAVANRMQGVVADNTYVGNIRLRQEYTSDGSEWSPQALEYVKPFLLKSTYSSKRS